LVAECNVCVCCCFLSCSLEDTNRINSISKNSFLYLFQTIKIFKTIKIMMIMKILSAVQKNISEEIIVLVLQLMLHNNYYFNKLIVLKKLIFFLLEFVYIAWFVDVFLSVILMLIHLMFSRKKLKKTNWISFLSSMLIKRILKFLHKHKIYCAECWLKTKMIALIGIKFLTILGWRQLPQQHLLQN